MTEEPDLEFSDCYEREAYLRATENDRWNQAKENFLDAYFHWGSFRRARLWIIFWLAIITYFSGPFVLIILIIEYIAALIVRFYKWLKT